MSDIAGQVFGRLTVRHQYLGETKHKRLAWVCSCSCGKEVVVRHDSLKGGNTKSCGCLQKATASRLLCSTTRPFERAFNTLIHSASKRGLEASLTYEDFLQYTTVKTCHYCGDAVDWAPRKSAAYHLDRKDSLCGYHHDNLVVACTRCNLGKNSFFTYDEWMTFTLLSRRTGVKEMKVTKACVYRLWVELTCGCRVQREYLDARYQTTEGEQMFVPCEKHEGKPGVEMLEMLLGEMLEKEALDAGKAPVPSTYTPDSVAAAVSLVGTVSEGGASTMGMGNKMPRKDPMAIKARQRSKEELMAVGALSGRQQTGTIDMEGVSENTNVTKLTDATLGFLIDKEDGLEDEE